MIHLVLYLVSFVGRKSTVLSAGGPRKSIPEKSFDTLSGKLCGLDTSKSAGGPEKNRTIRLEFYLVKHGKSLLEGLKNRTRCYTVGTVSGMFCGLNTRSSLLEDLKNRTIFLYLRYFNWHRYV